MKFGPGCELWALSGVSDMTSPAIQLLRSRGFALGVHVCLWLVLYLAISGIRGKAPVYRPAEPSSSTPQPPVPVAKFESLFSGNPWPKPATDTNAVGLFFTKHFVPPPSPAPPPPPTTKKIEVTYQGFFQTADGPKNIILKVGDAMVISRIGGVIASNLFLAEATIQNLVITNLTAQTNLLVLDTKKELEVPIK
jgi:hypothetical protein